MLTMYLLGASHILIYVSEKEATLEIRKYFKLIMKTEPNTTYGGLYHYVSSLAIAGVLKVF